MSRRRAILRCRILAKLQPTVQCPIHPRRRAVQGTAAVTEAPVASLQIPETLPECRLFPNSFAACGSIQTRLIGTGLHHELERLMMLLE